MINQHFFSLGLIVGFFGPILLAIHLTVKKLRRHYRNKEVDAKRRKTFKVVQGNQK